MDTDRVATERDQEEAVRGALEDYYRAGRPPWDTGVTPPELVALVEGTARRHPAALWNSAAAPEPTPSIWPGMAGRWWPSI